MRISIEPLYPIFPTVVVQLRAVLGELPEELRATATGAVRRLLKDGSHVTRIAVHTMFAMRILAYDSSPEAGGVLTKIYHVSRSQLIKRDVVLIMAARGAREWIEDLIETFERELYTVLPTTNTPSDCPRNEPSSTATPSLEVRQTPS